MPKIIAGRAYLVRSGMLPRHKREFIVFGNDRQNTGRIIGMFADNGAIVSLRPRQLQYNPELVLPSPIGNIGVSADRERFNNWFDRHSAH